MNQGIYKLVYSKVLNMYVPASEAVRNHGAKSGRRVRKLAKKSFILILIFSSLQALNSFADTVTETVLQNAVNATVQSAVNSTIIHQTAPKAILDWQRLNIGKDYLLKFDQQGNRTWSALNRIHDLSPTILNGIVQADGNVYFINTNGIVFGPNAQFNVGSLYAGTLDITDKLFNDGFINPDGTFTPVFAAVGEIVTGKVEIEDGAQITTAANGKVVLFAENIENSGLINTPDGQTILAAGKKVYLASSKDPAGFLVEVDGGGTATNLGQIVAERGNITMMGLAVNQGGTLTATTSVRANGSIKLLAQDKANEAGVDVIGTRNGIVTLAKDSITEVNPEYENKEETTVSQAFTDNADNEQTFEITGLKLPTSKVQIEASLVNIDGKVSAKGGDVTVSALNPASTALNSLNPSRIYLGDNAEIDVSGVDALAPMSRNQLEIQLFSDQLKDAPILRDSGLFKETVFVDTRKGTELFATKPFEGLKGVTIAEALTKSGDITLSTPNDLIVSKGAVLNVSGGSTTYEGGPIKETNLYYNGKLVPISESKPGVPYDKTADVYIVKDAKWGVTRSWDLSGGGTQSWGKVTTGSASSQLKTTIIGSQIDSYFEGNDAGVLNLTVNDEKISTQNLVLAGQLLANTKVGTQQQIDQNIPKGGTLIASANELVIAKNANELTADFAFEQKLSDNFQSSSSTDFLAQGFNDVDFTKVSKLEVNDTLHLKPNGKLILNQDGDGNTTQVNADIIAPGSDIKLGGTTTVADGIKISTAGTFTNDRSGIAGALSQPAAINGGSINASLLSFGKNASLDASAGAWVDNKGKLTEGDAGNIKLTTTNKIDDSVALQSYGFKQGGALDVTYGLAGQEKTLNIVGDPNASDTDIDLGNDFFNKGGFSKYSLSAFDINIGNSADTPQEIYASAQTWRMNSGFANEAGGQPLPLVASTVVQPDTTRKPVSLGFTADKLGGVLTLAENTTLRTDRGGSVNLAAGKQVNVLGDITTPSGNINIKINDGDITLPEDLTQAVFIGEKATLSASGSSLILPDSQSNLLKTQVFNAGAIKINQPSNSTDVQKGAVVIKDGAVLDVSGTSIVNDTKTDTGFVRETLHGDAGTISIRGVGGLLLDGDFKGAASGTGRDGTLDLTLSNGAFAITQQKQLAAEGLSAGGALTANDARAQLSSEQVENAGFANLNVKSFVNGGVQDSIELADGVDLKLAGNLKLETPLINVKDNGTAKIAASHITLKSPSSGTVSPAAGEGKLTTESKQLYIDGLMTVAGVKETSIKTTLDIHGQGNLVANEGGLVANGDINLTARQIYPNTGARLGFEAIGENSKITINSSSEAPKPVLSAAGELSFKADNIEQNGVLTAPFGRINFTAAKSAKFNASSVTSIYANNQIIPYLRTDTGGERYLDLVNSGSFKTSLLEKGINIKSADVDLQKNAVLDLSAGGDMFAYEWVPGLGGSKDILAQPNMYAVIPDLGQDYAPFDQFYSDSSAQVGVGQSVYLTGVPGLTTGTYTLLPARYALVPGAFLVEANVASNKQLPGQMTPQLDGSTLTSGYRSEFSTGAHDANWSTFKVTDGAVFHPAEGMVSKAPSQYILTSATKFLSNPLKTNDQDVSLPIDAGKLGLDATKLSLDSTIIANKQAGGSGLKVDISSKNIRVVNEQDLSDTANLQLKVSDLNELNAESVLLGGRRDLKDGVVEISTGTETVSIENNADNAIHTPEFITTAIDKITVKTGAVVDTGPASKQPTKALLKANGDGALLALSSSSDINYDRTGGASTSATGELNIEAASTLKAGNSVVLDATKSASLAGNVTLQDGGSATFGANRILIGDAPVDNVGLNVNAGTLAALGQLKTLTLNSYNNIDTFGTVNFGNDKLDLTMNAAGIVGHIADGESVAPANAASSVITAKNFTLKNTQNAVFATPIDPSGRGLEINAAIVKLDGSETAGGKTEVAGFAKLDIKADEIRVAKTGEANFNVAETKLTSGRIAADTAANYKIKSNDKLEIAQLASAKPSTEIGFGANLDIQSKDLVVAGKIDLSSGKLGLTATNDLNIIGGADISAASTPNTFYSKTVNAPAGSITLTSATGNVNVNTGAVLDVSSQGEANAGLLKVVATSGTTNIAGDLKGSASGTGKGGVLDVDVKTLTDLSATNNKAAGFTEGRQYRVRTGDVNITGTGMNALAARETIVSADTGKITVTGDIVATAPKNSKIGLFASNGVTLENTANLKANSTKLGEEGGKVEVYTLTGNLDLKAGSSIDVSGGTGGAGGDVHLRTPRTGTGSGNGVAVTNLATNIVGAKSTVLEAFKTFTGTTSINTGSGTGAALGFATIANDVNSFMTSKDSILASLSKAGDSTFHLRAGTEVQSAASLTVGTTANDWNLYLATRTGGEPGVLTLRAKDNITFSGSLSDGFTLATTAGEIGEGDSWAYRIVAGADFSAANPLATIASAKDASGNALTGNVSIANNKMVRTGTGNIDISAGGDLKMLGTGATIYTAGRNAGVLDGFDLPASNLKPLYLTDGGDISVTTQGNIAGGESSTNNRQFINQWLFRQGGGSQNKDTSWWVRPDLFKQSLATLGGGDIDIDAGGNISNFSASAPTTARFDTNGNTANQVVDGGGDVKVKAGNDINNGVYFVAKGDGEINAGGSIQKQGNTFGTALALQDGNFNVSAVKNSYIETTINPTLVSQSTTNATQLDSTGSNSYFNSYAPQAGVNVTSLIGHSVFGGGNKILSNVTGLDLALSESLNYVPGSLNVVSHNGDVNIGSVALLPASAGDLKVLAANNVNLSNITMSDADLASLPKIDKPVSKFNGFSTFITKQLLTHSAPLLHKNDAEPVLIVAKNGSISPAGDSIVTLPKVAKFVAGKDINGLKLDIQNNNPSDISLINAANDVKTKNITISGPGELLIQAGRNIDLIYPLQTTITTTGNSGDSNPVFEKAANQALPADGASITLQAGLGKGANVQGYIDQYILPTGTGPATIAADAAKLAEYRASTALAVTDYMRKTTGNNTLADAEALAQFNALNLEAKSIFANRHLTSELIASAKAFAKAGNHERGNLAIATLFPTLNQGDILLFNSKVSTNSGGSIDMLVPGGAINVGVPGGSSDVGVITEKGGEIRAVADKDIQVNQSKLITQFGSDIAIWSTNGTIDAGRGSKSATSVPERIVLTDANGNTTIEVKGVAAGSGIRAQSYDPDGPNGPKKEPKKGNVYLTAPKVDAGEAGIEAGDLLIVAPIVLNAANIQVQGASSGVPVAATSSLAGVSAGLSPDSVNSAAAAVAQSVAQSANQSFIKPTLPSIISVDVISIGD